MTLPLSSLNLSFTDVVSIFKFVIPDSPKLDADGDFELQRRPKNLDDDYRQVEIGISFIYKRNNMKIFESNTFSLILEHSVSTSLTLVGLQIWRGALLLADWIIYNSKEFGNNSKILELGSGVGLTSIIASMFNPVFCTGKFMLRNELTTIV